MKILNKCQSCNRKGALLMTAVASVDEIAIRIQCRACHAVTHVHVDLVMPCDVCGVAPAGPNGRCNGCTGPIGNPNDTVWEDHWEPLGVVERDDGLESISKELGW